MRRCIFCGRTEEEFVKGNIWTEEHIIPEALGNETLKIYDVCKECNSGLGTYVDKYFVNHMLVEIIRQNLGLAGQSGRVPNAFKEGKDKDNHLIRVDEQYHPYPVSYVEQEDEKIRIVAATVDEAKKIAHKKLARMQFTEKQIAKILENAVHDSNNYQPEIRYDFTVEFNRFYMEALKIAYEYAIYKIGTNYLEDATAQMIKNYLYKAIKGEMKEICMDCPNVCMSPQIIKDALQQVRGINCHMIFLHADAENKLIVDIVLFMESAFSFSVCVSEDADRYEIAKEFPVEVIDIIPKRTNF